MFEVELGYASVWREMGCARSRWIRILPGSLWAHIMHGFLSRRLIWDARFFGFDVVFSLSMASRVQG
jgi:hypothetical protein